MFYSFFSSQERSRYLFFVSLSFNFTLWSAGTANPQFCKFSCLVWSSRLVACMSKFHWSLCVSFSRTYSGLDIYHLFVWSNFNFWHISLRTPYPLSRAVVLYSFSANLLRSLIMWLIVSPLSPQNLLLLFCCV